MTTFRDTDGFVPASAVVRRRDADAHAASVSAHAMIDVEAELARFEAAERTRLGLDAERPQYVERTAHDPAGADRTKVTLFVSGLTMAQDELVAAALAGIGYRVHTLDCPDDAALRTGKEYGNRGQCNPTWFTVGNLVKHLMHLRDVQGMPTERIIAEHAFLTAGACGPCRFGMYVTEYRKALRAAGFDGFRVFLFQMAGGISQATGDASRGLVFNQRFFGQIAKALVVGDVLNLIGYRLRPFEQQAGATDAALTDAKASIARALRTRASLLLALLRARRRLARVAVDRLRVKPSVGIIGEFWAMTTEGDGNYRMQRFLESEDAEVVAQPLVAWVLFMIWEVRRDTKHRLTLPHDDEGRKGLAGKDARRRLLSTWASDKAMRLIFHTAATLLGLHGYQLPDMDEIADIAEEHHNLDIRGGEAHMEVAKNILNVLHAKVNMTLSIKPFGCMPSSGVSDGVQSAVTELYPDALYLPIETTGDGAVNVYSRVQMTLFKARQAAARERDAVLDAYGLSAARAATILQRVPLAARAFGGSPALFQVHASTAANAAELAGLLRYPWIGLRRWLARRNVRQPVQRARHTRSAPLALPDAQAPIL
jgi:predicted nucleotide-binding protein (sugar kinase/HSP70/actin superfamily)